MAEQDENKVFDGGNTSEENKTPDEKLTAPPVIEFTDTGGDGAPGEQPGQNETAQTEQAQADKPEQSADAPPFDADAPPAPDVTDGEKDTAAAQDKAGQDAPADEEKLRQEQEALLLSLDAKADEMSKKKSAPKSKDAPAQGKTGKPPQADKSDKTGKTPQTDKGKPEKPKQADKSSKTPKDKKAATVGGGGIGGGSSGQQPGKEETSIVHPFQEREALNKLNAEQSASVESAPAAPPVPEPPRDATRPGEAETIVYIDFSELHPFKDHPFQVRDDESMKALVESVKERGVEQPALVRPREEGGYEIVAGHRRQHASELAGLKNIPCIVRNMTNEEAVLAMTESNFTYRTEILVSEKALALKMQLDAIKRQGERFNGMAKGDIGTRSNDIVAEKNNLSAKVVQRYIALNNLTPDLMKLADDNKVKFMAAFNLSYIKKDLQDYIAMTIKSEGKSPTQEQAERMRTLDAKKMPNGKNALTTDVIDGILIEESKKEDRKVIISSQELDKYFGLEKSPKEMKDAILKILDEYKAKNPLELPGNDKTEKKKDTPEK